MAEIKAIKFKNFSVEDFVYSFDGIPYTFKAGMEFFMEDYKARHFAKHLVDRELNRLNVATNYMPKRDELLLKCFPTDEVVTPAAALDIESRKKVVTKKVVEEEFADLKVNKKKHV